MVHVFSDNLLVESRTGNIRKSDSYALDRLFMKSFFEVFNYVITRKEIKHFKSEWIFEISNAEDFSIVSDYIHPRYRYRILFQISKKDVVVTNMWFENIFTSVVGKIKSNNKSNPLIPIINDDDFQPFSYNANFHEHPLPYIKINYNNDYSIENYEIFYFPYLYSQKMFLKYIFDVRQDYTNIIIECNNTLTLHKDTKEPIPTKLLKISFPNLNKDDLSIHFLLLKLLYLHKKESTINDMFPYLNLGTLNKSEEFITSCGLFMKNEKNNNINEKLSLISMLII